jgi:hypothetical protein
VKSTLNTRVGTCLVVAILSATNVHAYHVHASGNFYTWENGVLVPLKFARVEIMDSDSDTDTILDDTLGTGNTDANGHFEIDGSGGDGGSFWWSKPDVYARVDLSDDYPRVLPPEYGGKAHPVRCTDELNSARGCDSPEHDHDNISGNVDVGSWAWGNKTESSAPTVWLASRDAFVRFVEAFHNIPPAGYYDIEYWSGIWTGTPWTNLDATHWPIHYTTDGGRVNSHEFGHSVRHSFDGGQNHFNWDVTRFVYARYHDLCDSTNHGFAFNEGWAEFWAGDTGGCNATLDFEVEGDVANALAQVASCCEAKTAGLLQTLNFNPGRIHSFDEFRQEYEKRFHDGCALKASTRVAVGTTKELHPLTDEQQDAWLQGELDAQSAKLAELERALSKAMLQAHEAESHVERQPYQVFQAVLKPYLLRASIQTRKLAIERLKSERHDREAVRRSLEDGTFDQRYAERKRRYLRAVWSVNLRELRAASRKLQSLKKTPEGTVLLDELRQKIARLERQHRSGDPPPAGMQPAFLTSETLEKVESPPRQ